MLRKPGRARLPRRMESDSAKFDAANDMLEQLGVCYHRPSPHQFKIGDINFYPKTGTITFDGIAKAWREKGLDALKERIEARRRRLNEILAAKRAHRG
ncbi:MAG: hypothetical protein JNM59_06585 [Hyphomonadaceae bacterium]|nr:hypothetical protein [Hyphomonadaceae bacterium]